MSNEHRARKRFGQNFLHDPNIIDRIGRAIAPRASESIPRFSSVVEIFLCPGNDHAM